MYILLTVLAVLAATATSSPTRQFASKQIRVEQDVKPSVITQGFFQVRLDHFRAQDARTANFVRHFG